MKEASKERYGMSGMDWSFGPSRSSPFPPGGNPAAGQRELSLDVGTRELRRGKTCILLSTQPFEILCLLLDRPGEVIRREDIVRRLWPEGTFVDFEHSLNAAIKRLRAALGDDAEDPKFVETIPRRGYRWIYTSTLRNIRLFVLPFSAPAPDDAFVSGLTEELFAQLSVHGAGRLEILSRHSASRVARVNGSNDAGSLAADYVLDGGVRRHGSRVRITVSLVDAHREVQTWGDIYECDAAEPVPAQIEIGTLISRAVVERVRLVE